MDPLSIPPREKDADKSIMIDSNFPMGGEPQSSTPETEEEEKESSFIGEIFKFAVLALLIVIPFRLFIAQPFIVSGVSMYPTFDTGEYIIVDQISYYFEEPQRGDVVIFKFPEDHSKYFIKRIIGLPGESLRLENGNTIIINSNTQEEITLNEEYLVTDKTDDHVSIVLSSNEYFVMGDNRGKSADSRRWGPVSRNEIVGRAFLRLLPLDTFSLFPGAHSFTAYDTGIGNAYLVD